jgi:hypothetical protein
MNFVPLTRDTKLIDYQNAQIILIGAREGYDIIKKEMGIKINYNKNQTAVCHQLTFSKSSKCIKNKFQ